MFGSLFGGGKKDADLLMANVDNAAPIVPKPKASHEGWLFKKGIVTQITAYLQSCCIAYIYPPTPILNSTDPLLILAPCTCYHV